MDDRLFYLQIVAASVVFFTVVHILSLRLSSQWIIPRLWKRFTFVERGDWVSRCISTVHCVIIVPAFAYALYTTEWDDEYFPLYDPINLKFTMCVSLGYFFVDFFVCWYYKIPGWVIFLWHHILASLPYYIHLFYPCKAASYVLGLYLLVETATIFLNAQNFLEQAGKKDEPIFVYSCYTTFVVWALTRLPIPVYCIYQVWVNVLFSERLLNGPADQYYCLAPAVISGHLILLYCFAMFFFLLVPGLLQLMRTGTVESPVTKEAKKRRKIKYECF